MPGSDKVKLWRGTQETTVSRKCHFQPVPQLLLVRGAAMCCFIHRDTSSLLLNWISVPKFEENYWLRSWGWKKTTSQQHLSWSSRESGCKPSPRDTGKLLPLSLQQRNSTCGFFPSQYCRIWKALGECLCLFMSICEIIEEVETNTWTHP